MSHKQSVGMMQFQYEHYRVQELLSRYAEIVISKADAASTYPSVAAHLESCEVCRGQLADLMTLLRDLGTSTPASRAAALRGLANGSLGHEAPPLPPLDLVFSENLILPIGEVLASAVRLSGRREQPAPALAIDTTGVLLYYDTLRVGKIALVVLFTLFRDRAPDKFHIEGTITPEHAPFRYEARLKLPDQSYEALSHSNQLEFHDLFLDTKMNDAIVVLEGYARWHSEGH